MASFFVVLLVITACDTRREEVLFQGATMGTTYSVKYIHAGDVNEAVVVEKVEQLLTYIDSTMSTYQEYSELNRLNAAPAGEVFPVSGILWQVLLIAERIFQITDGAFDPTVGPLVDLWGFGPIDTDDAIPSQVEIDALRLAIGFQSLKFLPSLQSVQKLQPVRIDLSAIAKGFAAQQVGELLADMTVENFLVEVGGELQASGLNGAGKPWAIAIEVPALERGGVQQVLAVVDSGVATSGDYRNYFERDGERFSHTIDPRNGHPIRHNLASVTVLRKDATEADALATAYLVVGAEAALKMANRDNVVALLLIKNEGKFTELSSDAYKDYISAH